ncbi:MAG: family 43 glycosylhydrolase [Clostridia bacterium]|nr:family 43 glycosylhydrolase [Clostridia bacterium]
MSTLFKKPVICSEYINIYSPSADVYNGPDTESFTHGQEYREWIPNDFTVLHSENVWHIFGITHPRPPLFTNAFDVPKNCNVHEAEYQLFHCTADGKSFADVMHPGAFKDEPKILFPDERLGEQHEIWAPHIDKIGDDHIMIYSPRVMRYAKSKDLYSWQSGFSFFDCKAADARDPFLFRDDDGSKYLLYCEGCTVKYRKTYDMINWSESVILQTNPFRGAYSESPYMLKHDGIYYLMWCIYDGKGGVYDNRAFVFASPSVDGFEGTAPITMLEAHAPEFVANGNDTYILSVFHPSNGISAAKIMWK